jgi:hypothetical protein
MTVYETGIFAERKIKSCQSGTGMKENVDAGTSPVPE